MIFKTGLRDEIDLERIKTVFNCLCEKMDIRYLSLDIVEKIEHATTFTD